MRWRTVSEIRDGKRWAVPSLRAAGLKCMTYVTSNLREFRTPRCLKAILQTIATLMATCLPLMVTACVPSGPVVHGHEPSLSAEASQASRSSMQCGIYSTTPHAHSVRVSALSEDDMEILDAWRNPSYKFQSHFIVPERRPAAVSAICDIISRYPPHFVGKYVDSIFAFKDFSFHGRPYRGTYVGRSLYLQADEMRDPHWAALQNAFHHELSSVILNSHMELFQLDAYTNKSAMEYVGVDFAFEQGQLATCFSPDFARKGFYSEYSTSSFENDFNILAAALFTDERLGAVMPQYPRLSAKAHIIEEFYNSLDPAYPNLTSDLKWLPSLSPNWIDHLAYVEEQVPSVPTNWIADNATVTFEGLGVGQQQIARKVIMDALNCYPSNLLRDCIDGIHAFRSITIDGEARSVITSARSVFIVPQCQGDVIAIDQTSRLVHYGIISVIAKLNRDRIPAISWYNLLPNGFWYSDRPSQWSDAELLKNGFISHSGVVSLEGDLAAVCTEILVEHDRSEEKWGAYPIVVKKLELARQFLDALDCEP